MLKKLKTNSSAILLSSLTICLIILFLHIRHYDFNLSSLIFIQETNAVGNHIKSSTKNHNISLINDGGYDGQYYYYVASNLFNIKNAPKGYVQRYRKLLYPLLIYSLSMGSEKYFPCAMILINLASVLGATYLMILLLRHYNKNTYLALIIPLNAGMIPAIRFNLTDPLFIFLSLLTIWFWIKNNYLLSGICLGLSFFTREIAILLLGAMCIDGLIQKNYLKTTSLAIGIIPYAVFVIFLTFFSGSATSGNCLGIPFMGIINNFSKIDLSHFLSIMKTANFIPFFVLLIVSTVAAFSIFKQSQKSDLFFYMLLFTIVFLIFDGTAPWGHLTGVARHGVYLFISIVILFSGSSNFFQKLSIRTMWGCNFLSWVWIFVSPGYEFTIW